MKKIQLLSDWGRRKKGTTILVLQPGERLIRGRVDPVRAQHLVETGLAEAVTTVEELAAAPPTSTSTEEE